MSDELKPAGMVVAAWQYRRFDVYWKNQPASWSIWWDCSEREAKEHAKAANTEVRPLYAVVQGATPSQPVGDMQKVERLIGRYWSLAYAEGKEGRTQDTEAQDAANCWHDIQMALQKLLEAKGEDAERYQWLRDESPHHASYPPTATLTVGHGIKVVWQGYGDRFKPTLHLDGKDLDAAIDAARSEVKP